MSALGDTLRALSDVLQARALRWYVFGAQAVAVRGAPRATQDVDVTVEVPRADLGALVDALAAQGLRHRYPELAGRLLEASAVLPLVHTSRMEVDLVIAGSGLERLALARATVEEVDGVRVPVAHATDLVVMKLLAARPKDLEDARSVLAGGEADLAEVRDLLEQLEEALDMSDLVPRLDDLQRS